MVGRDRAWIAGRQQRVIKLALTLEFIAGADTEDLEEVAVEDDRVQAELLLSAEERCCRCACASSTGRSAAASSCSRTAPARPAARSLRAELKDGGGPQVRRRLRPGCPWPLSSSASSPLWYISRTMSQPPTNSPWTSRGTVGQLLNSLMPWRSRVAGQDVERL